jgi:hypothetical protein
MSARAVGPEFLRVVLMGMIVLHHLLVHGLALKTSFVLGVKFDDFLFCRISLNAVTVFAVNAFVLISGYFGIRYKTRSLLYFLMQGVLYAFGIMVFRRRDSPNQILVSPLLCVYVSFGAIC